ncbi:hypothetical protein BGZ95_003756 [Linnemannia exigua]|uniref:WD40 repeat-like protein n=1 Tax=Linnemannia exigua TaxID=604196 RepID=A0AAD4H871_9FUNG|nr:hypothetical protein BGZ95_003756 [Linnemannia exigua]
MTCCRGTHLESAPQPSSQKQQHFHVQRYKSNANSTNPNMTNQPTNDPPPGVKMTPKGKAVFAKLENSAKRALHPSTKYDYSVVNAIAAVHVENSRILNQVGYFALDGATITYSSEDLGSHNGSQGSSENSSAKPRVRGFSNLASHEASVQLDSSSPTATPREETGKTELSLTAGSVSPNSAGHRFTSTLQLAFGQHLLSKKPSPSTSTSGLHVTSGNYVHELTLVLDKAEEAWRSDVEQDSIEHDDVRWLVTRVATEFINCANKDVESIAEVVLLGSVLDPKICHRVVSSLIGQLESEGLSDIYILQGLMQLLQEALPGSIIGDDLVRILRVLQEQLTKTYKALGDTEHAASERIYQFSTIVCRVIDAMMEGDIRDLNRAEDHKPLLDLLVEVKGSPDPYLRFQASYAWQALQYAGDDEPPLHAILRIGGGVAMAALSVDSVYKFDSENLFKALDILAQAAGQAFDVVKAGVEGEQPLRKGGDGAMDSLSKGFQSGSKRVWYPALQAARMCVRDGRLADFEQVIYEAPCRCESEFQWGICQLLGEIAMDPIWAIENRQQAVDLLGKLYRSDNEWITDPGAKKVILGILRHLSINTEQTIQDRAGILLQYLTTSSTSNLPRAYPLTVRMSHPLASPLLDKALKDLAMEYELRRMMTRCSEEHCQTVYIPPQAKTNLLAADKESSPLMDKVEEFLISNRQVFLVLGDSGAGKSTFNRHLERVLWKAYKPGDRIPLFISLPSLKNPETDLITEHLKNYDFSEAAMQELKRDRQFILICDGYDEARLSINLHSTNMFNRSQQWKVKMIISCRSIYLSQNYREQFQPQPIDRYSPATPHLFQEAAIVPFSSSQIEDYVEQFVQETKVHELSDSRSVWSSVRYMEMLKAIPNLMELVKNPFLLTLSLEALPDLAKDSPDFTKLKLTRLSIYDAFTCQWAHVGKVRLISMPLEAEEEKVLDGLIEDGFSQAVIDFLKNLAASIFQEQDGSSSVDYIQRRHSSSWKNKFFGIEPESTFLRQSSPLVRVGTRYSFIHHSLLEYFYSRHIFDAETPLDIARHPLSQRNLVNEPSILQFLAEYVHYDPTFKQKLIQVIELSKANSQAGQAAANAITILVKAGIHFNGVDLQGIKIPGADLSDGQFDSAQLQGADLRNTNLRNIWLRQADLSNAQMADVDFGELPYLQENSAIASGSWDDTVCLWDAQTVAPGPILGGHTNIVTSVAYSPSGQQIATGSFDKTVRLWNSQINASSTLTNGHTSMVTSVAYSPCGQQIASGSRDNTMRLWDTQTGAPGIILNGHTKAVTSVVFSPSGLQIASGSWDHTVRLWDAQTGVPGAILSGHSDIVTSVVYSPSGQQIASGSCDLTIRLWSAQTGAPGAILSGHTKFVSSMAFAPSGLQIASGSTDRTVRLWNLQSSAHSTILNHPRAVTSVVYSPCGQQIASGSYDKTVRLWDLNTGSPGVILEGHTDIVTSVVFSPSGQYIASGSRDSMVRLWDKSSGQCLAVVEDFQGEITSIAWNSNLNGTYIATGCRDRSVRMWLVKKDGEHFLVHLHWSSTHDYLALSRSIMHNVEGLSEMNVHLVEQRGAVCKPLDL